MFKHHYKMGELVTVTCPDCPGTRTVEYRHQWKNNLIQRCPACATIRAHKLAKLPAPNMDVWNNPRREQKGIEVPGEISALTDTGLVDLATADNVVKQELSNRLKFADEALEVMEIVHAFFDHKMPLMVLTTVNAMLKASGRQLEGERP